MWDVKNRVRIFVEKTLEKQRKVWGGLYRTTTKWPESRKEEEDDDED